jgi:hypothetical protein
MEIKSLFELYSLQATAFTCMFFKHVYVFKNKVLMGIFGTKIARNKA